MKPKTFTAALAFIICIYFPFKAHAQAVNVQDSLALVDLYNNTHGANWYYKENWLSGPVSTWQGITLNADRVSDIFLSNNNLVGSIPASLGNLAGLIYLNLNYNQLSGHIPAELGNLQNLDALILSLNQLDGNIPSSLSNLQKLYHLYLDSNLLTGSIPPEIGSMRVLHNLVLSSNRFNGNIPAELGNLAQLTQLNLQSNQLTGAIPAAMSEMTELSILNLSYNQLSGKIPAPLGTLKKIKFLFLNFNQLSDSIPSGLFNHRLTKLIDLSHNQLSGPMPDIMLGSAPYTKLEYISLSNNFLTGSIPASFASLIGINNLYLDNNRLSGDVSVLAQINIRNRLELSANRFTFEGMELLAQTFPGITRYTKQALVRIHQNGNALSVSAGGTLSNNSYKWFVAGSTDTTVIVGDSVFHPASNGSYRVRVSNTIATKLVLNSYAFDYTAPLHTQNSGNVSMSTMKKATAFIVYPNPAKDVLHIQINGSAVISITNQSGKILVNKTICNGGNINVSGFTAGTYYVEMLRLVLCRKL